MAVEDKDFIGKIWPQNCGDSLLILKKTSEYKKRIVLFEAVFQKYPYKILAPKGDVLKGSILNPQIEIEEFVKKEWPQNCGDILQILEKIVQGNKTLWKCKFKKYPCEILADKVRIKMGTVLNPQIEQKEFIEKLWPQNCGDILKIIRRTEKRYQSVPYYLCEFTKYPYKILALKGRILEGSVLNPLIEQKEFIGRKFLQNCGDVLKVIEKTDLREKGKGSLFFKCKFQKYPCEILATKGDIITKSVRNPNLPWNSAVLLKSYLISSLKKKSQSKISLVDLAKELEISFPVIAHAINKFNLREYIDYTCKGGESKIQEFLKSIGKVLNSKFFSRDLEFKEIDLYSEESKLGIEYNGNLWHSNIPKIGVDSNYHQHKSLLFKEKAGINIFHIFEYEWENREEIIKSLLKARFGIFDKIIGARQCDIRALQNKEYQDFCNINHLQGEAGARTKLGLFYKDELVQIMSFGSPRFSDKFDWEIIRECSKMGYKIIGGKQRLWNYFIKKENPKNCLSYCDFSKFTGESYLKLGFKQIRLNSPGFVWYNQRKNQVFWRDPYHHQEMKAKGYAKIYDCGQLVFEWYRDKNNNNTNN